jgi:hypothetical protein
MRKIPRVKEHQLAMITDNVKKHCKDLREREETGYTNTFVK